MLAALRQTAYFLRVFHRWCEAGVPEEAALRLAEEHLEEVCCAGRNLQRITNERALLRDLAAQRAQRWARLVRAGQVAEALLWVVIAGMVGWLLNL